MPVTDHTLDEVGLLIVDLAEAQILFGNDIDPTIEVRASYARYIEQNYYKIMEFPELLDLFSWVPQLKEIKVRYYEIPRRDNPQTYPSVTLKRPILKRGKG